jgi:hypothetical protein
LKLVVGLFVDVVGVVVEALFEGDDRVVGAVECDEEGT